MALIKPSGYTNPEPSDIITTSGRLDVLRRNLRNFGLNQSKDGISFTVEVESKDITVDWDANFSIGSNIVLELQDKERNMNQTFTSSNDDDEKLFTSVDTSTSFVVGYVENGDGYRVSNRIVQSVVVVDEVAHNGLPSWSEIGSTYEQVLISDDEMDIRIQDLKQIADIILDLWRGNNDDVTDVEQHVDIIFGAVGYDAKKLDETLLENSAKPANATALFPSGWTNFYPQETSWSNPSSFDDQTAKNIQHYSSPWGNSTRTAGDPSEWQDLQTAIDGSNFPVDIFDETEGTLVTYSTATEAQNRQDEIEQIVSDFNAKQALWDTFQDRYNWTDHFTNRQVGFRLEENLERNAKGASGADRDQADFFHSKAGLS